jgi:hypothetical protein
MAPRSSGGARFPAQGWKAAHYAGSEGNVQIQGLRAALAFFAPFPSFPQRRESSLDQVQPPGAPSVIPAQAGIHLDSSSPPRKPGSSLNLRGLRPPLRHSCTTARDGGSADFAGAKICEAGIQSKLSAASPQPIETGSRTGSRGPFLERARKGPKGTRPGDNART